MRIWASLPLVLAAVLGACASPYHPVTSDEVRVATARFPGSSRATLEQGRRLTLSHCGRCHRAFEPTEFRADAWPGLVKEMREGAGLDAEEESLVVRYLVTAAETAGKKL